MKILLDARLYGPENTGLGRYVMNLVENLVKIDRRNSYTILLRKKYFDRLNLPPKWKKVLADYRHYSLAEQIKLPGLISKIKPDIVHFPHFNVPIFYRGKFVVTIHDILMHRQKGMESTTLNPISYLLKRVLGYKLIFGHAVRAAAKVIVPSAFVKKEVSDYYKLDKDKVVVTYEGFDEKFLPTGTGLKVLRKYSLESPYFVYAGNAYPHKNLKRLIEAIVLLNQKTDKKVTLAIVSARDFFVGRLEKLTRKLNASSSVKLLGFVSDDELGALYLNSTAFVFPSLSEGFGLPGLEAMSVGTLVLASDIPVLKEVYKEFASYFNPYDYTSIEEAMENALSMDASARKERVEKAREFAKRYSWDKMARETIKVYESCAYL
jgi:glycosyltransferase involved in cell wall biosynthesis